MKLIPKDPSKLLNWLFIGYVILWGILTIQQFGFVHAMGLLISGFILGLAAAWVIRKTQQIRHSRRINALPNTRDWHYIMQRFAMLPYTKDDKGSMAFSVSKPDDYDSFMHVIHIHTNRYGDQYTVAFGTREYHAAAEIGNTYQYTVEAYVISQYYVKIPYERHVAVSNSGSTKELEYKLETRKKLPSMPDELFQRVEAALNTWMPVSSSN